MGNEVYANGMELACKAGQGKSICAFPDVCFTPPQTPATPPGVPIPYPNTGLASDTTDGSKAVQISGQEVMLKNKSYFKKSTGDEAGSAPKKGLVTSQIQGKVYFNAWSMDVKFEGENVVRNLDMTTHNHASPTPNTAPWPFLDSAALSPDSPCFEEAKKIAKKCSPEEEWKKNCPTRPANLSDEAQVRDYSKKIKSNACLTARRCMLVKKKDDKTQCCDGQTGDHIIDAACFLEEGTRSKAPKPIDGWGNYKDEEAPTVCAEGGTYHKGTHSEMHLHKAAVSARVGGGTWSRQQATKAGAKAVTKTYPSSGCSKKCIEAQLNNYHDQACTSSPEKPIRASYVAEKDPILRACASDDMGFGPNPF